MAKDRLKLYTVLALVCYSIAWGSGIYLALIGFRGNPAECATKCVVGVIPGGIAWLLVLLFGHHAFFLFVKSGRVLVNGKESLEIGSGTEEQRILDVVRELLSHLRVAKRLRNVNTVAWSTTERWDRTRFKWQGYRNPSMFVISSGLRDRLDAEDWRIYLNWRFLKLTTSQTFHLLQPTVRAFLPALALIAGATSLSVTLGQYTSELFSSIFGPPVILLIGYRLGPMIRKILLGVDNVAAESLGSMKLLRLFQKIDRLQLQDSESAKRRSGWASRLWPEPSITERIANLQ